MRYLFPFLLLASCLLTFLPGCEPKEDLVQSSGSLEFSTDSVKFDTVFTTVTTVTKRLWVYNRNAGAVRVERIGLAILQQFVQRQGRRDRQFAGGGTHVDDAFGGHDTE